MSDELKDYRIPEEHFSVPIRKRIGELVGKKLVDKRELFDLLVKDFKSENVIAVFIDMEDTGHLKVTTRHAGTDREVTYVELQAVPR